MSHPDFRKTMHSHFAFTFWLHLSLIDLVGLPIFCASIGVVSLKDDEPNVKLGVIYNPTLNEMLSAVSGRGVYLNGEPLKQRQAVDLPLNQSLVNVGFPAVKESTLRVSAKAVNALATKVRGLRMMACASQVMAWVAQDKFQSYVNWDLNAWDVCAGIAILREAGGYILELDEDGKDATLISRDLIICSPGVARSYGESMLQELKDSDCLEYS